MEGVDEGGHSTPKGGLSAPPPINGVECPPPRGGTGFRPVNRVELLAMGRFRLFFRARLLDATILPTFTRGFPH